MHLTGDSPINNKGRRACLATFISKSVLAAPMPEPTPEKLSKADNDIQQTRFRISSTREEPSHQASLMAGNLIPGPSNVPCLVESSTAHGDLLLWITFSSIGVLNLSDVSSYVSNLVQNPHISPLPSPKLPDAPQNLPANPCGRHIQICLLSITPTSVSSPLSRQHMTSIHIRKGKLGFRYLVGFFIYVGPSPKLWPITKISGITIRFTKPRSALSFTMLSPIPLFSRFSSLCGRRLHRRWKSEFMLWPCYLRSLLVVARLLLSTLKQYSSISTAWIKFLQRIYVAAYRANPFITSSSYLERTLATRFRSQGQSDYKLCVEFLNLHGKRLHVKEDPPALLRLVTHQMRFPVLTCQIRIQPLHLSCLMRDANHLPNEKPFHTSSFMERTLLWNLQPWPPMSKVENCHCFLVFGSPMPVTPKAKVTSTTSQNLLIVTNLYFADLFAEAFLTHHDLACGKVLRCFCLRVPMDLSLNFEAYPLWFSIVILIYFDLLYPTRDVIMNRW